MAALCINDSGTWRNAGTVCVNQSGTWRTITTGCINDSGTWRQFGFVPELGDAYCGGFLIYKQPATSNRWVVAPVSSQVVRNWYCRCDAAIRAQQVTGQSGWFVDSHSTGFACRAYWDSYTEGNYWTPGARSDYPGNLLGRFLYFQNGGGFSAGRTNFRSANSGYCVRAFRCVTY